MAPPGTTHKKNDRTGSSRKWAVICVAGGILLAVGALVALVVLMHERYEAKSWELMPVVEALERHEADHGHYPEKLAELVPDYLPENPPTELLYAPNLKSYLGENRGSPDEPVASKRNGEHTDYELRYCFGLNQCIVYRPGRDYPESIEGFFLNEVFDNGWAMYVT